VVAEYTKFRQARATRLAFHRTGIDICHFYKRQFDQAAAIPETSLHEVPDCPATSRFLCVCYVQMGRLAEARDLASRHISGLVKPGSRVARLFAAARSMPSCSTA
jgi:hypothetical protein